MVGLPADLLTEYLVFHPIRVCLKCLVPRLLNFLQTQKTSVVNPRFIGPIIFSMSREISYFSMVNPRKSTFFYGESQEISHFPVKSPCAEPPPHHASVGGIVRGLLGIRILFGRGDLHSAHLGDRRRDFGERRNGENTIDIYTYIYNSKNRYVLKKLSWYIIFLQWYITINGIPL